MIERPKRRPAVLAAPTTRAPIPAKIRHKVEPGDVPPEKAARRLYLTLGEFQKKLPDLIERGFPPPDPTTGNFDLDAIDLWRRTRNPRLYGLTQPSAPDEPKPVVTMGDRFRAAKERKRDGRAA
jgi:hypothetical protein